MAVGQKNNREVCPLFEAERTPMNAERRFRHLDDCSGCFRLERLPGGVRTHWKASPCHGARK